MNVSKKLRSGDEHYTPEHVIIKYLLPCIGDKRVYTPFGKDSEVKRILSRYTTVIDTPLRYSGDFFKAMDDAEFVSYLKKNNFIIVDNPPFSGASKINRVCTDNGVDFYLLGSTLTALSVTHGKIGYYVLGPIKYESKKIVNTCLFSNTFKLIKHLDPLDKKWKQYLHVKNRGFQTSGNLETLMRHGFVININQITAYTASLFGGAIKFKL